MKRKIVLSVFVLVVFIALGSAIKVKAEILDVVGWLWGGSEESPDGSRNGNETGVGWISVSGVKENGDPAYPGAPNNYGIKVNSENNVLSGYAWSGNLGWISFNSDDVVGCPAGSGGCSARREDGKLAGWARILSIKNEMAKGNSGGWQGFINLDKVTINESDELGGYGWNGEDPGTGNLAAYGLGWISFKGAKILPPNILKVCENSCDSGVKKGDSNGSLGTVNLTIRKNGGSEAKLVACLGRTLECDSSSSNITLPPTTWNYSPNPSISSVGIDGSVYKITSSNQPDDEGTTNFTVKNADLSAEFEVFVSCYDDDSCAKDTCTGSECKDFCGNKHPGEKDCSWREVAP